MSSAYVYKKPICTYLVTNKKISYYTFSEIYSVSLEQQKKDKEHDSKEMIVLIQCDT